MLSTYRLISIFFIVKSKTKSSRFLLVTNCNIFFIYFFFWFALHSFQFISLFSVIIHICMLVPVIIQSTWIYNKHSFLISYRMILFCFAECWDLICFDDDFFAWTHYRCVQFLYHLLVTIFPFDVWDSNHSENSAITFHT